MGGTSRVPGTKPSGIEKTKEPEGASDTVPCAALPRFVGLFEPVAELAATRGRLDDDAGAVVGGGPIPESHCGPGVDEDGDMV